MSDSCTVCSHPAIGAIDEALRKGLGYRVVARNFELEPDAVSRHRRGHLNAIVVMRSSSAEERLGELQSMKEKAEAWLEWASDTDNSQAALGALREMRQIIVEQGKIEKETRRPYDPRHVIPMWEKLREGILGVLTKYPKAREDVLEVLTQISTGEPE